MMVMQTGDAGLGRSKIVRMKDMEVGTVAVTGRGSSNRVVVIIRPEAWHLRLNQFGEIPREFSKGRGDSHNATNGVLAIETSISTGSVGYFYGIELDSPRIMKAIALAVAEAKHVATFKDEVILRQLNSGRELFDKRVGQLKVIAPANITHTIEQYAAEVIAQEERRSTAQNIRADALSRDNAASASIEKSLTSLGYANPYVSVHADRATFFDATRLAEMLAEIAAR